MSVPVRLCKKKKLRTFAERSWQNVLERGRMQKVHDLLLRQGLLHQQAKENRVAELAEVVEQLGAGVGVLHNVLKGGLKKQKRQYQRTKQHIRIMCVHVRGGQVHQH